VAFPDGRPAVGSELTLVNGATGERRTARADAAGGWAFPLLPPGGYDLRAESGPGWAGASRLSVRLGTVQVLHLRLQPAGSLTVDAVEAYQDPARTHQAAILGPEELTHLPISRRRFSDFSLTTPGVAANNTPLNAASPASNLSIHGMSARQNQFLVDGFDNNDLGGGSLRASLSLEAVQEFQVITGGTSAEYGRALGGTINTVTKGGSNAFGGSLFAFHRPGSLAADRPHLDLLQAGASASGPMLKDQFFYFVAVEKLRLRDENEVAIQAPVLALIQANGFSVQGGRLPFEETETSALFRLDWLASERSRFTFRFMADTQKDENQVPWGGLVARSAGGARHTENRSVALTHRWLGETWANEAGLLVARRESRIESLDPQGTVYVDLAGAASFGTQRLTGQDSDVGYLHLKDTLTLPLGTHLFKAGVDLLRTDNEANVPQNFSGFFAFQALPSLGIPDAVSAFAAPNPYGGTGIPVAFVQSFGQARDRFRAASDAVFLQDDWQVTPSFLVKLGLRFEREGLPAFADTPDYQALQTPPALADPIYGPVQLPAGTYDYAANFRVKGDWSSQRLCPRFGFSWQGAPGWRLYGGAGRYSGALNLGLIYGSRLYNGTTVQTLFRTILDPNPLGPITAWANGDGLAQNHRYQTPPPGDRTFIIPGRVSPPTMDQWTLGLEWKPAPNHSLTLDLLQGRVRDLMNVRDVNAFQPTFSPAAGQVLLRRVDLRYSALNRVDDTGRATTEQQSLAWSWTPSSAWQLRASYTHGRTRDNTADWTSDLPPENTFDPASEWGPSDQQQTHRFSTSGLWHSGSEGPAWRRDWTFAWIASWASGRPYSRLVGFDQNFNGEGTSDRPLGAGRNDRTTPSTHSLDLRLARTFHFRRDRLELLLDVINAGNSTAVLRVQANESSRTPPPGTPITFGPRRQVQFGVKLSF